MGKYKIDVPVGKGKDEGSSSSSSSSNKETDKNSTAMKSLTKAVAVGNVIAGALSGALSGVAQLFQPLIRILSALFIVIFLPLLPLLIKLTDALADLTAKIAAGGGGVKGLAKVVSGDSGNMGKILKGAGLIILGVIAVIALFFVSGFVALGALIIAAFLLLATGITVFWDGFKNVLYRIWEGMKNWWEDVVIRFNAIIQGFIDFGVWVGKLGASIWEWFKDGLKDIAEFHLWIWDIFVDGLKGIANLGSKIWGVIKSSLSGLGNMASGWFGGGKASGGSVSAGTTYLVGENGPELFSPGSSGNITPNGKFGGSTTINVNNPVVRNDQDIRKLTDMISKKLQSQGNRGFSSR